MRRFLRAIVLAASALACSDCVPADEPTEVPGSLAVEVGVSDVAHEPIALADGWSFRFDRVLLSVYASAITSSTAPPGDGNDPCGGLSDDSVLFDALTPFTFRINRLDKGRCEIDVNVVDVYRYEQEYSTALGPGVTAEDRASLFDDRTQNGASMLLEGTATRGASTKKLSLRMGASAVISSWLSLRCGEGQVVPGERHTYRARFDPTRIFADALQGGTLQFDAFADADVDQDGTVTFDEIAHVDLAPLRLRAGGYASGAQKLAQFVISLVRRAWVLEADPNVDCTANGAVSWE